MVTFKYLHCIATLNESFLPSESVGQIRLTTNYLKNNPHFVVGSTNIYKQLTKAAHVCYDTQYSKKPDQSGVAAIHR